MGNFNFFSRMRNPPPAVPQPQAEPQRDERNVEENDPVLEQRRVMETDSPIGRRGYLLEDVPAVNFEQRSLETPSVVEPLAVEVRDRYQDMVKLYQSVKTSLDNFKAALGEPPVAELTACFAKIKEEGSEVDIRYEGGRLRVVVGEGAQLTQQVERAIGELRLTLDNMQAFKDKKEDACRYMDEKVREIRGLCGSQADLQLYEAIQGLPEEVKRFANEIQNLEHDIPIARDQLIAKPVTGVIRILPDQW